MFVVFEVFPALEDSVRAEIGGRGLAIYRRAVRTGMPGGDGAITTAKCETAKTARGSQRGMGSKSLVRCHDLANSARAAAPPQTSALPEPAYLCNGTQEL